MDEELKALSAKMDEKLAEAKAAADADAMNEAMDAYDALQKQYDAHERLLEAEKAHVSEHVLEEIEHERKEKEKADSTEAFAKAARAGFRVKAEGALSEGVPSDGGYTVPEDISTEIYHLREAEFNMRELVDVRRVRTMTGSRTIRTRAQHVGFSKVGEGAKIPATGKPGFDRVEFKIEKYGGYMPVTNELLADTAANIRSEVVDWFSKESRVTGNKLIMATADESSIAPAAIGSLDALKKVVNVDLGQAFAKASKIVTNDDGLQILDTLKDDNGNYLLKTRNNDPLDMYLAVGTRHLPVRIVPNIDLASDASAGVPFYVGDLKEGIKLWDRMWLSLMSSNVAAIGDVNAFEEDLTIWRGIEREDCTLFDEAAFRKCFWNNNAG